MPRGVYVKTGEHRLHLSQSCRGRVAWNKGVPCSEEQKKCISETLQGHIPWNKGIPMSEEQKGKLRLAMIGQKRPKSEEQRGKLRESLLVLWKQPDFRTRMCTPERTVLKRKGALNSMLALKNKWFHNTKPEMKMSTILDDLGIQYIHPYPVWGIEHCYPADFYLPDYNLILEVDGKHWHNYPDGLEIDHIRTQELVDKKFKVMRFWENEFNKEQIELLIRGD